MAYNSLSSLPCGHIAGSSRSSRFLVAKTKTLRHGSSPSNSVSVDDGRGGLGERFVASWNERVGLVEDDDAWRGGTRSCKYRTDRAAAHAHSL
jgi:hypothetical protein